MSGEAIRTLPYPNLLLGFIGLVFLTAPVWVGAMAIDADRTTFEAFEVTTTDGGIVYVGDPTPGEPSPVSDRLGCGPEGRYENWRSCGFENYLADTDAEIVVGYATNPDMPLGIYEGRYRYVQANGTVYEPGDAVVDEPDPNRSSDTRYPIRLTLEPVDAEAALDALAVAPDAVPGVIREAARSGETTARTHVNAPADPIAMGNGTYQRVIATEVAEPGSLRVTLDRLAQTLAPLGGIALLTVSWYRVRHGLTAADPTDE